MDGDICKGGEHEPDGVLSFLLHEVSMAQEGSSCPFNDLLRFVLDVFWDSGVGTTRNGDMVEDAFSDGFGIFKKAAT